MPVYVLSPDALQDLQDIWDFVALDSVNTADKLGDEFFNAFEKSARQPRMGHTRTDLTERDVRFWTAGSYLIVYRERPDALQVLAVLHGSRDVPEVIREKRISAGLTPQEQISRDKAKEHDRNYPIHREERGVQFAQIVVAYQGVFIQQQCGYGNHSDHRQFA